MPFKHIPPFLRQIYSSQSHHFLVSQSATPPPQVNQTWSIRVHEVADLLGKVLTRCIGIWVHNLSTIRRLLYRIMVFFPETQSGPPQSTHWSCERDISSSTQHFAILELLCECNGLGKFRMWLNLLYFSSHTLVHIWTFGQFRYRLASRQTMLRRWQIQEGNVLLDRPLNVTSGVHVWVSSRAEAKSHRLGCPSPWISASFHVVRVSWWLFCWSSSKISWWARLIYNWVSLGNNWTDKVLQNLNHFESCEDRGQMTFYRRWKGYSVLSSISLPYLVQPFDSGFIVDLLCNPSYSIHRNYLTLVDELFKPT